MALVCNSTYSLGGALLTYCDHPGIGGAQILRYMDSISGMHGPYVSVHLIYYTTLDIHTKV
jgi:hypothetical protein